MHDGYFQVIAEPVSTCVQEIFELRRALAALRDEVVDTARALLRRLRTSFALSNI